jgi:hypothetical protein
MSPSAAETSRAQATLRDSPLPALRRLSIRETDSCVTIVGRVSSYYLKQLAQEAVMSFLAGRTLVNRVTVDA